MNVRSKYDTDEPENRKAQMEHMRGMCGLPYEMFEGPARVDTSQIKGPKFLQKIFQILGWKTKADRSES